MASPLPASKKLLVLGGTGFLGSRICRSAVSRNWTVIALSRSGNPVWSSITSSPTAPEWASKVSWEKGDVLDPASYRDRLKGVDAVVHSMGILLEGDYKGVLQGKESVGSAVGKVVGAARGEQGGNPLERKGESQDEDGAKGKRQITYEVMNRDSAISLAKEAADKDVETFVFISAAGGAPILPKRYITTKREAESTIASRFPKMRSIFMRPGFLYDSSRFFTVPLAYGTFPLAALNWATGKRLSPWFGAAVEKPLQADVVANAVVEAIDDGLTKGPVITEEIEELANKAWRKDML